MEKYCDGVKHCADGSDEDCTFKTNATVIPNNDCKTKPGLFFCDDTCFPLMKICDGARDCLSGKDEEDCDKKQRIYQVVSIGVNERTLNSTSFLIYWWIAVPQNMTFEYLPSIFVKDAWKNNTDWILSTEYRFLNLDPFTLYNVTVYVRIQGSKREFVPYLYYEVATAEGGELNIASNFLYFLHFLLLVLQFQRIPSTCQPFKPMDLAFKSAGQHRSSQTVILKVTQFFIDDMNWTMRMLKQFEWVPRSFRMSSSRSSRAMSSTRFGWRQEIVNRNQCHRSSFNWSLMAHRISIRLKVWRSKTWMRLQWRCHGTRLRKLTVTSFNLCCHIHIQRLRHWKLNQRLTQFQTSWMERSMSHESRPTLKTTPDAHSHLFWNEVVHRSQKFRELRRRKRATTSEFHGAASHRRRTRSSLTESTTRPTWRNCLTCQSTKPRTIPSCWRNFMNVSLTWLALEFWDQLGQVLWERTRKRLKHTTVNANHQGTLRSHLTMTNTQWKWHGSTVAPWTTKIIQTIL